jgi:uncharacterized membrane protein
MSQAPPPPPPPPASPPPPPPSGQYPAPGGAAFNIGDAISYGWNALWKNVGVLVPMMLIVAIIPIVLILIGAVINNTFVFALFYLVALIIGFVLGLGLIRAALAITRGEKPAIEMLFSTDNLGPYVLGAILFAIGNAIATFICLGIPILSIVWLTLFGFFGYVIVDRNEQSPIEALKISQKIVGPKFWPVVGLLVLLYLINFVGIIICGIGLLFTAPLTLVAHAYAYRTLSGEPVAPVV